MNTTRLYTTVVGIAASAALWATPVTSHAAIDCDNTNTGASSINTCSNTRTRVAGISRTNLRDITKLLLATALTGGNLANANTMDGTATGGLATTLGTTNNIVTDGGFSATASPSTSQNGSNNTTGASSLNTVTIDDLLSASVLSSVTNLVSTTGIVTHNTGDNQANANTGNGTARGGNSLIDLTTTNVVTEGPMTVSL